MVVIEAECCHQTLTPHDKLPMNVPHCWQRAGLPGSRNGRGGGGGVIGWNEDGQITEGDLVRVTVVINDPRAVYPYCPDPASQAVDSEFEDEVWI